MDDVPEFENESVEKASKWTIYFLIDLRVVFIILYVYVTAVNLISTTATAEAMSDSECSNIFNITTRPEHTNVNVSSIDDAILWNCRKLSVTRAYYKGIYILLLVAFFLTLAIFFIVKLSIICGAKHDSEYLKRIAVLQYLEEEANKQEKKLTNEDIQKFLSASIDLKCYLCCSRASLFFSIVILVIGMGLSLLFYDLHVLSCVFKPSDDFIAYNRTKQAVELRYSDNLSKSQKAAGGILFGLFLIFLMNCFIFYHSTTTAIQHLKKHIKNL